jgi:hypothetical protein
MLIHLTEQPRSVVAHPRTRCLRFQLSPASLLGRFKPLSVSDDRSPSPAPGMPVVDTSIKSQLHEKPPATPVLPVRRSNYAGIACRKTGSVISSSARLTQRISKLMRLARPLGCQSRQRGPRRIEEGRCLIYGFVFRPSSPRRIYDDAPSCGCPSTTASRS